MIWFAIWIVPILIWFLVEWLLLLIQSQIQTYWSSFHWHPDQLPVKWSMVSQHFWQLWKNILPEGDRNLMLLQKILCSLCFSYLRITQRHWKLHQYQHRDQLDHRPSLCILTWYNLLPMGLILDQFGLLIDRIFRLKRMSNTCKGKGMDR